MYSLLRFFLFLLPADLAHAITLFALRYLIPGKLLAQRAMNSAKPIELCGITFSNRVGLSAGFDKNGEAIDAMLAMGFGFVEVGAVTPKPQQGNPKPHVTRLVDKQSLLNRCGFNNKGVDYLVKRLKARTQPGVVGVNIGPNRDTIISEVVDDYRTCMDKLYPLVDYLTINISCPNSGDSEALQQVDYLHGLLSELHKYRLTLQNLHQVYKPLLVKVSPDLKVDHIKALADLFVETHMDGVIVANTSKQRKGIEADTKSQLTGGMSGKALAPISRASLALFVKALNGRLMLISNGGIDSKDEACERISMGASLVQIYTGFVYHGPSLLRALRGL